MQTFKDSVGRDWTLTVNVRTGKLVRDLCHVDLFSLFKDTGAANLFGDPITVVDVLYVLCKDQCEKLGLTDVQFGEAMVGDAWEHGSDALLNAVIDFFPKPRADILRETVRKGKILSSRMLTEATAQLAALNPDTIPLTGNQKLIESVA